MTKFIRIFNYGMILVFLICAAIQYNDPDPVLWMAIYGVAALSCMLFAAGRLPRFLPVIAGGFAMGWAIRIAVDIWGKQVTMSEVFGTLRMISEEVEQVREIGGLLIILIWMSLLFAYGSRKEIQT